MRRRGGRGTCRSGEDNSVRTELSGSLSTGSGPSGTSPSTSRPLASRNEDPRVLRSTAEPRALRLVLDGLAGRSYSGGVRSPHAVEPTTACGSPGRRSLGEQLPGPSKNLGYVLEHRQLALRFHPRRVSLHDVDRDRSILGHRQLVPAHLAKDGSKQVVSFVLVLGCFDPVEGPFSLGPPVASFLAASCSAEHLRRK